MIHQNIKHYAKHYVLMLTLFPGLVGCGRLLETEIYLIFQFQATDHVSFQLQTRKMYFIMFTPAVKASI